MASDQKKNIRRFRGSDRPVDAASFIHEGVGNGTSEGFIVIECREDGVDVRAFGKTRARHFAMGALDLEHAYNHGEREG